MLVDWLDFTACQPLGYFMPKTFLFDSFLLGIQLFLNSFFIYLTH